MFRSLMLVFAVCTVYAAAAAVELYTDKYDYVDADAILANDRLREQYQGCFMDTAPCVTSDAKFFRSVMAESIATKCQKCTPKLMEKLEKMIEWYSTNQPEVWKQFMTKYLEEAKQNKLAAA